MRLAHVLLALSLCLNVLTVYMLGNVSSSTGMTAYRVEKMELELAIVKERTLRLAQMINAAP